MATDTEKDQRIEIIILVGVVILLLLFWHRNRQNGAAGATIVLPSENAATNSGVPLGLTMPNLEPDSFSYDPGDSVFNIGGIDVGAPVYSLSTPTGCGCSGVSTGMYGSATDLATALARAGYNTPANLTQADVY